MDFRILGPLEVWDDGSRLALGGGKQRALLAILLLHRGEVVSTDRLIDELWGERPPATAAKSVHVYVSHLRRILGDGRLETHGHGYCLCAGPDDVDLTRFEHQAAQGRALLDQGDPHQAAALLRDALALWRGPPLGDLAYEPFAQGRAAQLQGLRPTVLEDRVEADLALGRDGELVAELYELLAEYPLRERLRGQLMLALYRAGRQAEALECFQEGRSMLVDELGLEPGPALQELERAILVQDPELAARRLARGVAPVARARTDPRLVLGLGTVALALAIGAVLVAIGGHSSGDARPLLGSDTLGAIDPATGALSSAVHVAGAPARIVAIGRTLWVGSDAARTLTAVDARTGGLAHVVAPGAFPDDLAAGEGGLWVLDRDRASVVQVNPAYTTVQRRIRLHDIAPPDLHDRNVLNPWTIAAGAGGVWVTDGSRRLLEISPVRGRVVRRIDVGRPLDGLAVAGGALWAISGPAASVLRVDPSSGRVTARVPIVSKPGLGSPYPIAVEAGLGAIWVLSANTATVSRVDPGLRGVTATIPIGLEHVPLRLAVGAGHVWVAGGDGTLSALDPRTGAVRTTVVARGLADVAVANGRVWVSGAPGSGVSAAATSTGPGDTTALSPSFCSPVYHAGGVRPQLLIAADLPLQGSSGYAAAQVATAAQFLLREEHFQAGRYAIGFQVCDDSTAADQFATPARCAANARAYGRDRSVVAILGPFNSNCAAAQLAILNRAPGGPLATVSPATTYTGFTQAGVGSVPGEPARFYPTGVRGFARVLPPDDVQGTADTMLARRLGVRRLFVLRDGTGYGDLLGAVVRRAARILGLRIVGTARMAFDYRGAAVARLAETIRRSGADGVFIGSILTPFDSALIRALRRVRGARMQIVTPDGFFDERVANAVGAAAEGMTISFAGRPVEALGPVGRRFARRFAKAIDAPPLGFSFYGAQAAQVILDAIARSDGTRRSVVRQLLTTRIHGGIVGDFAITPTGDTTATDIAEYRIEGGRRRLLAVISPPPGLLAQV
ncbi:MAG: hypothetical protein QOF12_483, partial [Solirubrobacteraceae bacterium]|nr:hypothetical protein [Solirubrobacteraceae bacterium]